MHNRASSAVLTIGMVILFLIAFWLFLWALSGMEKSLFYWLESILMFVFLLPIVQYLRKEEMNAFSNVTILPHEYGQRKVVLIASVSVLSLYLARFLYVWIP